MGTLPFLFSRFTNDLSWFLFFFFWSNWRNNCRNSTKSSFFSEYFESNLLVWYPTTLDYFSMWFLQRLTSIHFDHANEEINWNTLMSFNFRPHSSFNHLSQENVFYCRKIQFKILHHIYLSCLFVFLSLIEFPQSSDFHNFHYFEDYQPLVLMSSSHDEIVWCFLMFIFKLCIFGRDITDVMLASHCILAGDTQFQSVLFLITVSWPLGWGGVVGRSLGWSCDLGSQRCCHDFAVIRQKRAYSSGCSWITSALKKQNFLWLRAEGEGREVPSVTGLQLQEVYLVKLEKTCGREVGLASRTWEWPLADSHQGNGDLGPIATRNSTLSTTWNWVWKENASPEPPGKIPAWPIPWFQPWETLTLGEPTCTSDLQP